MKIVRMRAIEGPNVYNYKPVLIMRLDLGAYTERDSYEYPGLADRLLDLCPGLYDHYCAMGRPGGFVERLYGGTYFGHIVEHVCLELMTMIGYQANFGKTRNAGSPPLYDVIIEYQAEWPTRFLLSVAVDLVDACARGIPYRLGEALQEAAELKRRFELGPSTQAIINAAARRDIPVRRIGEGSLLQLGTGCHRRFVQATITQHTSAVGVDIASNKAVTKEILRTAGIRVPHGYVADSLEEARHYFSRIGAPVVLKPLDGCQGRGVTIDIRDSQMLCAAYDLARRESAHVVVEEYVEGRQFRFLVVAGRVAAVAERIPAHVVGNGRDSIAALVDQVNQHPDRGEDHEKPLTRIRLDAVADAYLRKIGKSVRDVPRAGERVFLRDSANLSTGGTAIDVTADCHVSFRQLAARAADMVGLDVCGIDVIADDIRQSIFDTEYAVIEVNAAPGIRMHHHPSEGASRDVAAAIVESLYPQGARARIPVVSITGTNGKTTTTRVVRHILQDAGFCVGMTTTEGVWIGEERVALGDTSGPDSARMVLHDPRVEAAVLETARGGIVRGGLGYDVADVGVITNISDDHVGQDGLHSVDDIVRVKSLVAECIAAHGVAVLSADDPVLCKLAGTLKHDIVYVSLSADNAVVRRHLSRGGTAFYARDGWLMEAAGALEWRVVAIEEVPLTLHGAAQFHVANVLFATAAARQLGVSRGQCAQALRLFRSDTHNPGRINVFRLPSGTHVISDYGHNPDGIRAVGETIQRLASGRVPAVIGFPGDRTDQFVRDSARMAAKYFYPLIIKEDGDTRGRQRGEMARLIADEIAALDPEQGAAMTIVYDECQALEAALAEFDGQPLVMMFHETLGPVRDVLLGHGAQEVSALTLPLSTAVPAV